MTGSAAGRVLVDRRAAGSGFTITDDRALTAGHVVRPVTERMTSGQQLPVAGPTEPTLVFVRDGGEPGLVRMVVAYQPEGAEPIPVTRIEVNTSLDVAVLYLQRSAPGVLPVGPVTTGTEWRVETRPKASDPTLTGTVTDSHRRLQNQRGEETTLIQLWVREELGDYQGYSGSPVTAPSAGGAPSWVLGVLVEQGRWRTSPQPGEPVPVANVLFAAPIDQVLAEFGLTGVTAGEPAEQIPLPVPFEVRLPQQLNRVIDALLTNLTQPSPDVQLVGLVGMGGSGKSVLAAATTRDPKVREAFPDGRFWLELGIHPPLLQLQARLAAALGNSTPITDVPQGRARLSRLLGERRCLLVLDNVWDRIDLSAFAVVGPSGRLLVTTRDAAILPGDTGIPLDELAPAAALQLLAGWTATPAGQLPAEAAQVAQECGYLPLALALCGAMIAAGGHSWPQLLNLLRHTDLDALHSQLDGYPHQSLAVALGASIDTLPPDTRGRYMQLAVFEAEGPVPLTALQVLWGLDREHTAVLVDDLAGKSLLHAEADRVSLHDLQMDYLVRLTAADLPTVHNQLLAAYAERCQGGWASGPDDGYFYQHLAHHLRHANRLPELQALLVDLEWMNAKLTSGNLSGLLADYDTLPSDSPVRLVASALRLSAHVLADDPGQLPSQLTGRLASQHDPLLRDLVQRIRRWPATPWLRPLTASLTPAGGPMLRILTGHDSKVNAVAASADGRRAVSGDDDGTVRVWDLDSGERLHTLTGHSRRVNAVAVSADGRRVVSGGDGTVRVWDLGFGAPVHTLTGHDEVLAVAVSADGRRAVSGGYDGTMRVWDLDSGALLHILTGQGGVKAVAVSADGRRAVSGGYDEAVRVWDLGSGALLHALTGHSRGVDAVAVSADGRRAVSGGGDGTVRVWDLGSGALLHALTGHSFWVDAVAVSADGRRAVSGGGDGTMRVWDLDSGALLHTLTGHGVNAVAVSPDGRRAVSGGYDGTVRVWDLGSGAPLHAPTGQGGVNAVAVSPDGRRAVSGGYDGTVRVWDLGSGAPLHTLTGHSNKVNSVAMLPDGRRAVSGGDDGTVRVWDLGSGAPLHTLTGHSNKVNSVAVSADGRRAVSGGDDGTVRVWDLGSGAPLHTLTGHSRGVNAVAVSADGRRAVSSGDDGTVRVWDLATGRQVGSARQRLWHRFARFTDPYVRSLSVSADGRRAVSGGGTERVRVWDVATGARLRTLTGHHDWMDAVAVSADGRRAVSGSVDGTVRVWDLDSGEPLYTLTGHYTLLAAVTGVGGRHGKVAAVAVSADGCRAVSNSGDEKVRMWDLAQGVELACFTSDSQITALAATPSGMRLIAGTSTGPVLLELCGCE